MCESLRRCLTPLSPSAGQNQADNELGSAPNPCRLRLRGSPLALTIYTATAQDLACAATSFHRTSDHGLPSFSRSQSNTHSSDCDMARYRLDQFDGSWGMAPADGLNDERWVCEATHGFAERKDDPWCSELECELQPSSLQGQSPKYIQSTIDPRGLRRTTSFEDVDRSFEGSTKKHIAYNELLYYCLNNAPGRELSLKDIYAWFVENSPYGKDPTKNGWRNSIRHNLSMNEVRL